MEISFPDINIAKYKFVLMAKDKLILPPYKGATLRGAFGITFRRICCVSRNVNDCKSCLLRNKCAYSYIFETSPEVPVGILKRYSESPHPFVIEPPLETKTEYLSEDLLEFNLILIGKAIEYLPYFIFTFRELGKNVGLGKNRGKYELCQVTDSYQNIIYDSQNETIKNYDSQIKFDQNFKKDIPNPGNLSLNFFTPTRIKFRKDLVAEPEFHILIRSLLHRISALSLLHCGKELNLDDKHLISESEKVTIKKLNLKWVDWERYSSRQDTKMKLGGFIGEITYTGNFELFYPLLLLGEYLHLGKNTTFGLGKYEIIRDG